jgi:hypothetical protein
MGAAGVIEVGSDRREVTGGGGLLMSLLAQEVDSKAPTARTRIIARLDAGYFIKSLL